MVRPSLLAVAVVLVVGMFARPAHAQVWVDESRLGGKLPDWVDEKYVKPSSPPTYDRHTEYRPTEYRRVWVEPVYRVACKRVWVDGITRTEYDRVWVPARYEVRETVTWEGNVKVIRQERVCVAPGYHELRPRQVVVRPGGWQTVETRELVSGGYWKLIPA